MDEPDQPALPRITVHDIVERPVLIPELGDFPIGVPAIVLPDGSIYKEALSFSIDRLRNGDSMSKLIRVNQAIGFLVDFYFLARGGMDLTRRSLPILLQDFVNARFNGYKALNWKGVAYKTANDDGDYITQFSNFCVTNFRHFPLNPSITVNALQADQQTRRKWSYRIAQRRQSFLGYLDGYTRIGKGDFEKPTISGPKPGRPAQGNNEHKHFPEDLVEEFIEQTPSILYQLAFILLFFGGLRGSELCHIWVDDIGWDAENNWPLVRLAHPELGYYYTPDLKTLDKWITVYRRDYLKDQYDLIPRNRLTNSLHAGWKSLYYDKVRERHAFIYWTSRNWAARFYALHQQYMDEHRQHITRHPYYFMNISDAGGLYGEPMKLSTLQDRWDDACKRLNLTPSIATGTNLHGARHFYGWTLANRLKIPLHLARRYMHHVHLKSTEVYYNLSTAAAAEELRTVLDQREGPPRIIVPGSI